MPNIISEIVAKLEQKDFVQGIVLTFSDEKTIYLDIFLDAEDYYQDGKLVITALDFSGEVIFNYFKPKDLENNNYKVWELTKRLESGEILVDKKGVFTQKKREIFFS